MPQQGKPPKKSKEKKPREHYAPPSNVGYSVVPQYKKEGIISGPPDEPLRMLLQSPLYTDTLKVLLGEPSGGFRSMMPNDYALWGAYDPHNDRVTMQSSKSVKDMEGILSGSSSAIQNRTNTLESSLAHEMMHGRDYTTPFGGISRMFSPLLSGKGPDKRDAVGTDEKLAYAFENAFDVLRRTAQRPLDAKQLIAEAEEDVPGSTEMLHWLADHPLYKNHPIQGVEDLLQW